MKKIYYPHAKFSAFVTDSNTKEKKDRGQLSELGGLKI